MAIADDVKQFSMQLGEKRIEIRNSKVIISDDMYSRQEITLTLNEFERLLNVLAPIFNYELKKIT